jgi:tetratricopeptide (TPR) repeat protein
MRKQQSDTMRHIAVMLCLIIVTACASSPWKQQQAESHLNIGSAYLGAARYNEALKELLQAEKLTPSDPKVHYYMGASYYMKGLRDKAVDELNKAISYDSNYSDAHNFLGTIYLEQGQWDKAIGSFNLALSNIVYETPDKALFNMGRAYHGKADYRMALNKYLEAQNSKPNTVSPFMIEQHMGMANFAQGNIEEAVLHFQKALGIVPSFTEMHYWLGQCYIKLNNEEKAKAEFQHVIQTAPNSELATEAQKGLDSLRYKH